MEKENSFILMAIATKENLLIMRLMDMELTTIKMALNTKVNGKIIYNTDLVVRYGKMATVIKASILMVLKMVKANIIGVMDKATTVNGLTIKCMVMVSINGMIPSTT